MKRVLLIFIIFSFLSCGMGGEQLNDDQSYIAGQAMLDMSVVKSNATNKIVADEVLKVIEATKECKTNDEIATVLEKFTEKAGVKIQGITGDAILNVSVQGEADTSKLAASFKVNFTVDFNNFGYEGSYKAKDSVIAKKSIVTLNGKYKFSLKVYASVESLNAGYDIVFNGSNIGCKVVVADEVLVDTGIYCYFRFKLDAGLSSGAEAKIVARLNGKDLTKENTFKSILNANSIYN